MAKKSFFVLFLLVLVLGLFVSSSFAAQDTELILYNGKILTVDKDFRIVDAVAIRDGKFVATGKKDEVMRFAGEKTKLLDLEVGGYSGLIDSHNHVVGWN
jgi:predicted amidohydrolase YtcJ